jgi:tRNA(Arg) A34 adenosine deaminase TadA
MPEFQEHPASAPRAARLGGDDGCSLAPRRAATDLSAMFSDPVQVDLPAWVDEAVAWDAVHLSLEDRMRLAIGLARRNVEHGTGGPFAAAVFERDTGRLVAVGTNSVVRLHNCTLHGEMVAFMLAGRRLGSFTLDAARLPPHELVTSCEPCAMCLGAILWSGVRRVVCGATRDDATRLRFDEGPVFPESYRYLESRGIEFVRGVLRTDAVAVMEAYRALGGPIYNG